MKHSIRFFLCINLLALTFFASGQALKVITYNIRLDTPVDSINQWPNRKNKVFALLTKYNPDIVGVQEAQHHQLIDLLQNLPAYSFIGVGRDDGQTGGEYSAILYKTSRLKMILQNTSWLSETPDVPGSKSWDAAITRVMTYGKFEDQKTGKTFFIFNTHFDHMGKAARANSAQLIKSKVEAAAKKFPVIVMGDFNCERSEPPYSIITGTNGLQLFDARPANNDEGTFCGFKVNAMQCIGIDYIFYSAQWHKESYNVIKDNDGMYYPSDHLPVAVEFKL